MIELHDVRFLLHPPFCKLLECVSVQEIHEIVHLISVGRDGEGGVENKGVDVNAVNLVFRVVERVQQSLRNVDTRHCKEEPLFFHLAGSIHLESFFAVSRIKAKVYELFKTKNARAAKVSRWVLALETNVDPFARQPIVKFFVRFKRVP